jgi:ribonuclease E
MAQASAELRDPTAPPGAPAPARADDLLAQMAGTEIDRLLADADPDVVPPAAAGRPRHDRRGRRPPDAARPADSGPAGPASANPPADAAAGEAEAAAESDDEGQPARPPAASAGAPLIGSALAGSALAGADATLAKELDQVFDRQLGDAAGPGGGVAPAAPPPTAASGPTATPDAASLGTTTPATASPDGVNDLLDRLAAGERPPPPAATTPPADAAADPAVAASGVAVVPGTAATMDLGAALAGVPAVPAARLDGHAGAAPPDAAPAAHVPAPPAGPTWAARLLAWLAVPLDPFPDDAARDAVGKVAIITAVNAVAVLVYVLFVRG